jgi:hypothetical protein
MDTQTKENSAGQLIGLVAALAVLLCFFLPWVEVGVSFVKSNLSGYQLATGSGPAGLSISSWTSLLLVPASMLVAVAAAIAARFGYRPAALGDRLISITLIAAGGASAAVILYQYFDLNAEFNKNIVGVLAQNLVSHMFGWGASLFGSFIVLAGGVLDLSSSKKESPRTMAAGGF